MNVALVFAGGTGQRMNSRTTPKQFLKLHGKPIIIYTLEQFENHPQIDAIVVVCLENWISYLEKMLEKFGIAKVAAVIAGGSTGQESIRYGVEKIYAEYPKDTIVLIHDGVRPLVDAETISQCIKCVLDNKSAVTVVPAIETVVLKDNDHFGQILNRNMCYLARAPQCFYLADIYAAHQQALRENQNSFIDSAQLMSWYGCKLFPVEGKPENIKITTPSDFYIFRAIEDAKEDSQIFGL